MTIRSRSMLAIVFAPLLVFATSSLAGAACPVDATHRLMFKVKHDQCVEKVVWEANGNDAEEVHVHEGDTVCWLVTGPKKSIVFGTPSPFSWNDSGLNNAWIEGLVRAGALADQPADNYKYSVTVDGMSCVLDPKIIVDP